MLASPTLIQTEIIIKMEYRELQTQKKQSSDCLFRLKIGAKERNYILVLF
jgi:hypothetical protein